MNAVEELRKDCNGLKQKRKEELETALNNYLLTSFLDANRPWRAVIGNRKCKPIPIYKAFYNKNLKWPELSKDFMKEEFERLGFVIAPKSQDICICVPPVHEGEELTFAQAWVKRINHNYSQYCANEYKRARKIFEELINDLRHDIAEGDQTKIEIHDGYTFFRRYKVLKHTISRKAYKKLKKLMKSAGIEEVYDEERKYLGIKVYEATN